jgi:tetratricopeptide (TPR) repeat protein
VGAFGLGKNLQEQGKSKEAIPYFEKAISIDPSAAAYYRLAKSHQATGDKAKAINNFEKSTSFRPELPKKLRSDADDQLKALKS